jgi:hypothetical protein
MYDLLLTSSSSCIKTIATSFAKRLKRALSATFAASALAAAMLAAVAAAAAAAVGLAAVAIATGAVAAAPLHAPCSTVPDVALQVAFERQILKPVFSLDRL